MASAIYNTGNSIIRTRQLLMYHDWVPRRVRVWMLFAFGFLYQYAGSINLSSMNQMVSEISFLSEDVQMAGYCMIAGITVCFPVMYRLKFALYSRQMFFIAGIGLIVLHGDNHECKCALDCFGELALWPDFSK